MTGAGPTMASVSRETTAVTLFSPIRIGSMEVKNRIIMPAMILNYPIEGYTLSPEWCDFYARGARGGAGLIICGATYSEMTGKQDEHQLGVHGSAAAGLQLMPWRYVGFFTEASYTYAPVISNLLGDTHDSGGFTALLGTRVRIWGKQ